MAQKVNALAVVVEESEPRSPGPAVSELVDFAPVPSLLVQSLADVIVAPCLRLCVHCALLPPPQMLLLAIVTVPVHAPEVKGTFAQVTTVLETLQVWPVLVVIATSVGV